MRRCEPECGPPCLFVRAAFAGKDPQTNCLRRRATEGSQRQAPQARVARAVHESVVRQATVVSAEAINEAVMSAIASICRTSRAAISLETPLFDLGLDSIGLAAVVGLVEVVCGASGTPATLLDLYEVDSIGD